MFGFWLQLKKKDWRKTHIVFAKSALFLYMGDSLWQIKTLHRKYMYEI